MISANEKSLYDTLDQLDIEYTRFEHPPVYTVEEAQEYWQDIEGAHSKNLFLRNNKGNKHYLVVLEQSKKADIKDLSAKLAAGKLSFASERRLKEHLGLDTGAVSPFGLINDSRKAVTVALDRDLQKKGKVNFHPNVNTATINLSFEDFDKFLKHCGNEVIYI